MRAKVTLKVEGEVTGWVRDGETEEQAKERIAGALVEAEIHANGAGDPRFHLSITKETTTQRG